MSSVGDAGAVDKIESGASVVRGFARSPSASGLVSMKHVSEGVVVRKEVADVGERCVVLSAQAKQRAAVVCSSS